MCNEKNALRSFALALSPARACSHRWFSSSVARTVVASKASSTTPLEYPVAALDVSAVATRLSTALQFETISYDEGSDAAAFESFRAWLVTTYPRFHAVARRTVVGDGTLIYEWTGSDASLSPIVLMAHQDVVPVPQPERWRHPPFSGAIVEGSIWGRGALDDKSALIAIMEAAESLIAAGHTPARSVIFVFGHDEESGGAGARAAAECWRTATSGRRSCSTKAACRCATRP